MTIGVIGSGAMGSGIAQVAAQSGHNVLVYDTNEFALKNAKMKLSKILDRLVEKGRIKKEEANAIFNRIMWVDNIKPFSDCGLVIEAIVERLDAKKSVFSTLEGLVGEDTILATNTSSLSIAAISSGMNHPHRLLGIHFFNPAPLMPLVEIIPSLQTDQSITQKAEELIKSWKKVTVIAKDTPGFIVNRVARPFYSEAIKMDEEGLADMATIDWAMKTIGGFRMGPFELMDLIGHDVNYVVTETVWTQFYYDPRFRPSITQKRLTEAGLYGRKSGKGFYDYSEGAEKPAPNEDQALGQEIVDRIVAMLINEAADAVFLNIGSAKDIDLAMTKGVNYPKGLLQWANELGMDTVLNRLQELHAFYGDDRYRPCPLMKQMAQENKSFNLG